MPRSTRERVAAPRPSETGVVLRGSERLVRSTSGWHRQHRRRSTDPRRHSLAFYARLKFHAPSARGERAAQVTFSIQRVSCHDPQPRWRIRPGRTVTVPTSPMGRARSGAGGSTTSSASGRLRGTRSLLREPDTIRFFPVWRTRPGPGCAGRIGLQVVIPRRPERSRSAERSAHERESRSLQSTRPPSPGAVLALDRGTLRSCAGTAPLKRERLGRWKPRTRAHTDVYAPGWNATPSSESRHHRFKRRVDDIGLPKIRLHDSEAQSTCSHLILSGPTSKRSRSVWDTPT